MALDDTVPEKAAPEKARPIRYLEHGDLPEVLQIERESFPQPWSEADFRRTERHGVAIVYEVNGRAVAYLITDAMQLRGADGRTYRYLQMLNLAVSPFLRLQGIGTQLVGRLIEAGRESKADVIWCDVRERNTVALMFLRKLGFQAKTIFKQPFEGTDEDGIRMVLALAEPADGVQGGGDKGGNVAD